MIAGVPCTPAGSLHYARPARLAPFRSLIRSAHEQHFPIGGQGPQIVRHDALQAVAGLAERTHRGNDLVAEVLRVLVGVTALMLEEVPALIDPHLALFVRIDQFVQAPLASFAFDPAVFTAETLCATCPW